MNTFHIPLDWVVLCDRIAVMTAKKQRKPKKPVRSKKHKQNDYGLSYNAMIVLAIRNSPAALDLPFYKRASTVKDIYRFLRTHVKPLAQMNKEEWDQTQRVIRHSLSQTTYFH
uniref:Fork-head domain-containing protein n=1 Tax=Steinernema glaseri TaxID=37863 RepID=A0A1I8A4U5_9BILA